MARSKSASNDKPYKRVALYIRCSTLEQAKDGYGLESQLRLLQGLVQANEDQGWITSDSLVYREEGISGASNTEDRPELSRLKADIDAGKIDVLCVWKIDRLFRKVEYLLHFVEFLKEKWINFVSKSENIDLFSPMGKIVLVLLGAVSEMERSTILERTLEGKKSKSMQGYVVYGKYHPFGYSKEHDGRWNKLVVNPEEAEIVREIFSLFVEEWKGTGEIANILTSRGIGTNIDRRSQSETGLREKLHAWLFRQTSIVRMLRNEAYIWKYVSNRYEHKLEKNEHGKLRNVKIEKDESEWVTIGIEPIVDQKVFDKAQELLDGAKVIRRNRWENHIFTGLVKCAKCERSFNYYKSHAGTGQYRCGWKKKDKVSKANLCDNRDISQEKLIALVWPKIEFALRNKIEFLKSYEETLQDGSGKLREDAILKELSEHQTVISKNVKALKNTIRMQVDDPENAHLYDSIRADLATETQVAEKRKTELGKMLASYAKNKARFEAVSKKIDELKGKIEDFTVDDKGFFIRELTDTIVLSKTDIGIGYRFELSE